MKTSCGPLYRVSRGVCSLLLASLLIVSCGGNQNGEQPPIEQKTGEKKLEIANPASVNCEQKGGRLEMMEEQGGQFGVCVFEDGSRCEEWRFYRNECVPGTCRETTGICQKEQ